MALRAHAPRKRELTGLQIDAHSGTSYSPQMATKTAPKRQEKTQSKRGEDRVVANNRRAFHDYFIEQELETGIALTGSIRARLTPCK